MKINKSDLKAIIKECLVELLAEGLGSNLTESVQAAPRAANRPRNRDAEPLPGMRLPPRPAQQQSRAPSYLDERVNPPQARGRAPAVPAEIAAITRDPIMAAIFADTAQTTLQEQARGVMPGDTAAQAAARAAPEQMFDEATMDKWNQAAFQTSRPGPAALPADFLQDLLKGD